MPYSRLALAFRLLRREWRAGELAVLIFALALAVASATAVGLFADRLQRTLVEQAAQLLGADLVVESHQPIAGDWLAESRRLGLAATSILEFPSMASAGERFLLVSLKAVEAGYPLRGALRTAQIVGGEDQPAHGIPAPGEVWAEARLLAELDIALGGAVELGTKRLVVTRLLTHEPDRRPDFYSLSPRLLMNATDLAGSGLLQAGSRAHWFALFAGDRAARDALAYWLESRMQTGQRLLDVDGQRPELSTALTRAERYLGLAAAAVALLGGVAVAFAATRHAARHYDTAALLRCLGACRRDVAFILGGQLLLAGLAAALGGLAMGWMLQEALVYWLKPLLPVAPEPSGWRPALSGVATGLLVLAGFAWPALARLGRLTPLRVLRRDLEPPRPAAWLVGLAVLGVAGLLIWRSAGDTVVAAVMLVDGVLLVVVMAGTAWLALHVVGRCQPSGFATRQAWRRLLRQPGRTAAQAAGFAVTLAAMAVTGVVRQDLMEDWRRHLDPLAPNYFAINLFEPDLARFRDSLKAAGVAPGRFYPVVRGRLMEIDGRPAQEFAAKDSEGERALNRELNFTWTDQLPPDNRIVAGDWWEKAAGPAVSLEKNLAESLHLGLGDRVTFQIAGRRLEARVASLRSLRWDSMTPNFYVIFPPRGLEGFAATYLTSFHVPAERRGQLRGLPQQFPGLTLLDVDQLLRQFQGVLRQVTLAVDGILAFALAAGLALLWAALLSQVDERLREDALLRALGAARREVRRARLAEFLCLGGLAGAVAAMAAEFSVWAIYRRVLHMPFVAHGELWLVLPVVGAVLAAAAGLAATRRAVAMSPLAVLRE